MCSKYIIKQLLKDEILKINFYIENGKSPPKDYITKKQIIKDK